METIRNGDFATIKVVVGSGLVIFLIGSIFWAGATYNRIEEMNGTIERIEKQIDKIGDIGLIEQRTQDNQKRLDSVEGELRELERRSK